MAREFRLLGDPVEHSLSPRIHAAAFAAWGVEDRYVLSRVSARDFARQLRAAARGGGGNVTLPHKEAAAALIDRPGEAVTATGACNCFWPDSDGGIRGDNTDVGGFVRALGEWAPELRAARVLVLGAGGAARAVIHALAGLGAGRVDLWNRTADRATVLAASREGVRSLERLPHSGDYDLVVNATRLGLDESDPLPIDLAGGVARRAFDLVYSSGGTAWVRHAGRLGIPARDGLSMLVYQAALSLRHWFPDREPPIEAMFDAVGTST